MEIFMHDFNPNIKPKVAVFDFDGTISTLRLGWENIMEPLMIEMIVGSTSVDEGIIREVREYINVSTGIQTIFQMQWLLETIKRYGRNPNVQDDPWWYKEQYNLRLMERVKKRKRSILNGEKLPEDFLIKGSRVFLDHLRNNNVELFVASGTDHPDVLKEVEVLGLKDYFSEIAGAPIGQVNCSKEAVFKKIISENKLHGSEVVVIGDGKVEIKLGRTIGARTLGMATDEEKRTGVNPVKRERLINAGANAISGDFSELNDILAWLNLK